jgi:hypothetical protein
LPIDYPTLIGDRGAVQVRPALSVLSALGSGRPLLFYYIP